MKKQQTVWVVSNINEKKLLPLKMDRVSQVTELPEQPPFAVILSKNEGEDWISLISQLRQKPGYLLTPVFHHGDIDPQLSSLFDGRADEDLYARANLIHERLLLADSNFQDGSDEAKLMTYLYSRPDLLLHGYINSHTSFVFEFPLVTALLAKEKSFDGWYFLQELVARGVLANETLRGEIQSCSKCHSGLLNIKVNCPKCKSIDIKSQKFIHCFSCGKIGPIPELLRQERLVCAQCNTRLQELGVDYEMPKEDRLCNSCGHCFFEPEIIVTCLVCHQNSLAHELIPRRLYDYSLTRLGDNLVRGVKKSIYRQFKRYFKVIDYDLFITIFDWHTKLAVRYSSIYFSVLSLKLINEGELITRNGDGNVEQMMSQLFISLRQVFRDSDLVSRHEDAMYFLLPMTNKEGCFLVMKRVIDVIQQLSEQDIGAGLRVGIGHMTSEEIIRGAIHSELLVSELSSRMVESNICFIEPK